MSVGLDDPPISPAPADWSIANASPPAGPRRARGRWPRIVASIVLTVGLAALTLSSVQAWLHIGSEHPDCRAAGVTAPEGREGTCAVRHGRFGLGKAEVSIVVNHNHTLRMPGYDARLVTWTLKSTRVSGDDDDYPGGNGFLASYAIEVTNTGDGPLALDADATDIALIIPLSAGSDRQIGRPQIRNAYDSRGPSIGEQGPIAPGQTVSGWAEFIVPIWGEPMLKARPANLEFLLPGHKDTNFNGLIRLWK